MGKTRGFGISFQGNRKVRRDDSEKGEGGRFASPASVLKKDIKREED